jgi:hypothetical protein
MRLLSLQDPKKSHMPLYTTQTCSPGPDGRSLINSGGGYHLGAPKFRSAQSSSFPSSILHFPLIAPPGLKFCNFSSNSLKPHGTSKVGGSYRERLSITRLLPIAYTTKHSILSSSFFHGVKQSGLVRVFLVQLWFH